MLSKRYTCFLVMRIGTHDLDSTLGLSVAASALQLFSCLLFKKESGRSIRHPMSSTPIWISDYRMISFWSVLKSGYLSILSIFVFWLLQVGGFMQVDHRTQTRSWARIEWTWPGRGNLKFFRTSDPRQSTTFSIFRYNFSNIISPFQVNIEEYIGIYSYTFVPGSHKYSAEIIPIIIPLWR